MTHGSGLSSATSFVIGALVAGLATAMPAVAAEIEGVRFADQVRSRDVTMQLRCVGLLRYKILIKAYVAALYLGDGGAADDVLSDVPKRLELSYFWSIKAADFGKAGDEILKRNVDESTFTALRPRLDRINGWYRDVKPGDRYSLTYVPGVGTALALNGAEIGVIDGADFAKAYFRIWLGDEPIDAGFRDQLLGCRRDVAKQASRAASTSRRSRATSVGTSRRAARFFALRDATHLNLRDGVMTKREITNGADYRRELAHILGHDLGDEVDALWQRIEARVAERARSAGDAGPPA